MKLIKVVSVAFILIFAVGCDRQFETANSRIYKGSFFVMMPTRCVDVMLEVLKREDFAEVIDYNYEAFLGPGEAYSDVYGFVELIEHEKHDQQRLLDMSSSLVSECYPSGSYGIYRDGTEFTQLAKEIAFLEENDVEIFAIKINDEVINIHIDFFDLKDKGLTTLDSENFSSIR